MKITRSPMARLMVVAATFFLIIPTPTNACDFFRRSRCRVILRPICQPVVCQPQGVVIQDSVVVPNSGTITIPSVITPTGQAPPPPTVDENAPNSGPPAPGAFSLDTVKSSKIEETHPPDNDIQQRFQAAIRNDGVVNPETIFSLIDQPRRVDRIDFQLHTANGAPTRFSLLNLGRSESVKAAQEETPDQPQISLLGLGEKPAVKANQEDTPVADEPAAPPVAAEAFVLANDAAPVNADDQYPTPKTEIVGAETKYKIGDLIELWVKPLDKKPEDLESVSYTWTVLPQVPIKVWPDSTRVLFGTGSSNTTYVVILNASYVFAERDPDDKIDTIHQRTAVTMATVTVGTGAIPGPGTGDNGNGNGNNGPSLSGLAKMAYDWTTGVTRSNNYNEAAVKADATKLAASFRSIAARIQNGTLTDVSSILRATKDNNDAVIANRNEWLPWFTKMSEHLQTSYNNGTIKTTAQFNAAWLEIATGLDAVAK